MILLSHPGGHRMLNKDRLAHFGLSEETIAGSFKDFLDEPMIRYGRGLIATEQRALFDALLEGAFRAGLGMGGAMVLAHLVGKLHVKGEPEDDHDGK